MELIVGDAVYDLWIDGILYEDLPLNTWELALPDDEYTWRVRSVDAVGNESAYSEPWHGDGGHHLASAHDCRAV